MYEANSQEFKPKEGELPNTMLRFNIDEVSAKTKSFKDSDSEKVAIYITIAIFLILAATAWNLNYDKRQSEAVVSAEVATVNLQSTTLQKKPKRSHQTEKMTEVETDSEFREARDKTVFVSKKETEHFRKSNPHMGLQEQMMQLMQRDDDVINPDEDQ
jgi:hypothetical protein